MQQHSYRMFELFETNSRNYWSDQDMGGYLKIAGLKLGISVSLLKLTFQYGICVTSLNMFPLCHPIAPPMIQITEL